MVEWGCIFGVIIVVEIVDKVSCNSDNVFESVVKIDISDLVFLLVVVYFMIRSKWNIYC